MTLDYPNLPEVSVDPIGDLILDFLIGRDNESACVDFKETINVSTDGPFAKIAKDIFAFSNYGGGYILLGFKEWKKIAKVNEVESEKPSRTFIPVGLSQELHVDQASLQEKFNSYSNFPIAIDYREFWRNIDGNNRKFSVIYVNPSPAVIYPKKKGIYVDSRGKTKTAFAIFFHSLKPSNI